MPCASRFLVKPRGCIPGAIDLSQMSAELAGRLGYLRPSFILVMMLVVIFDSKTVKCEKETEIKAVGCAECTGGGAKPLAPFAWLRVTSSVGFGCFHALQSPCTW